MDVRNIRQKALKAFFERDATKGLPTEHIEKIRDIAALLLDADTPEEVLVLARYSPHKLKGERGHL